MLHILARITVKPESAGATRDILTKLVGPSRQEAGCISYVLYQQAATPHIFQTVEAWTDQAAFDSHMSSAHLGVAVAAATPMFANPPEILPYTLLV